MDRKFKKQLIELLNEGIEGPQSLTLNTGMPVRSAFLGLKASGYLDEHGWTTLSGRAYLQSLKAPRKTWFKRNWFAASVAFATILAAVGGIVVEFVVD